MQQEFTISSGTKIFNGLLAAGMSLFSIFLFYKIIPRYSFILVIPLVILVIAVLIIVTFLKRKIVLSESTLLVVTLFSVKELQIAAIKGFRIDNKIIKIEPISVTDTTLVIGNYIDFKDSSEILEWLFKNFKDLDALDLETEHQKLLRDTTLGFSENEREEKIKKSKQIANAYNIISGVLSLLLLFITKQFGYIVLFILPLLGILLLYNFELIKFLSNSKRSVSGFVFIGMLIPCFALLLKSTEFNLLYMEKIVMPVGIVSCVLFLLLCVKGINKSIGSVIGQIIAMLIVSCLYGFGSIRSINCSFDSSRQLLFNATVLDHHINHGKSTSYYLKLSPWGPQHKEENESVSKNMYFNTQLGEIVTVKYKEGYLKAPWFVITPSTSNHLVKPHTEEEKKAGSEPLYIVDDQIVSKSEMEKYDAKDIDSVTVIKDKAGVEKYGEEGKNGVVIIITRAYLRNKKK